MTKAVLPPIKKSLRIVTRRGPTNQTEADLGQKVAGVDSSI